MKFTKGNITIITPEVEGNMDPLPDIGSTYYSYDDGKIRRSREVKVTILKYRRMWTMPRKIRKVWKEQCEDAYWLYAKKTDYVVVAESEYSSKVYFVRTHGGHWHSIWYEDCNTCVDNLSLDITGEMHTWLDKIEEEERKCHVDG